MTAIRPLSRLRLALGLGAAVALGFTLGACFTGLAAEGLPCQTDAQCGPSFRCQDDYCGGVFACFDGPTIELDGVCDARADCADLSDEDAQLCDYPLRNRCGGDDVDQVLRYLQGPETTGVAEPMAVVAANFVNGGAADVIVAPADGTFVKLVDFGSGPGDETEYFLGGPAPAFGARRVADLEVADLDGGGVLDVVFVTDGDGVGIHVFRNNGDAEPTEFGAATELVLDAEIQAIELGQLDDDGWVDLVAIVEVSNTRQVFTALGNKAAEYSPVEYFAPEASLVLLDYDDFFDSALLDVDGNTLDDLVVSGATATGPNLWVVRRAGLALNAWDPPELIPLMGDQPVVEIAVAPPRGPNMRASIVGLVADSLVPFANNNGELMPDLMNRVDGFGTDLSGLTLADLNCDGISDWLVNVGDPGEVRIWLGDDAGGVVEDVDVTFPGVRSSNARFSVTRFDTDESPDIIQAVDSGNLASPELRVWFTSDPMAGERPDEP